MTLPNIYNEINLINNKMANNDFGGLSLGGRIPIGSSSYLNVMNYRVSNNVARISSPAIINTSTIRVIVGVRVTLDRQSVTLYNVLNDSGSICITDDEGLKVIIESLGGEIQKPINTYTVINSVAKINDTRYVDYSTVTRMTPVKTNERTTVECTSPFNTVLFYTDGEGLQRILGNKEQA